MSFLGAYRELLARRDASRLAVSAIATRLPTGILNLGLLLAVQSVRGSFGSAAIVWAGFTAAFALVQPVTSRLVARGRTGTVLAGCLAVHVAGYAAMLIALQQHAPTLVFVAFGVVLGASTPPVGPLVRARWSAIVEGDQLRAAYALDAVITESAYLVGPLLVSLIVLVAAPVVAVITAGLCTLLGVVVFLLTPGSAPPSEPGAPPPRRRFGVFAHRPADIALAMVGFHIFASGCMSVTVVAIATSHHEKSLSGVLLGIISIGVIIGGLAFGRRAWPGSTRTQLVGVYGATAAMLAIASLTTGILVLAILLAAIGLIGGAIDTLLQIALGSAVPAHYRAEAFAWLSTVMWASSGLGTAVGGQLVSGKHLGSTAALLTAAAAMTVAALWALGIPGRDLAAMSTDPAAPGTTAPGTAESGVAASGTAASGSGAPDAVAPDPG
jgi:MFS family permease